jgi:hypothetical protein
MLVTAYGGAGRGNEDAPEAPNSAKPLYQRTKETEAKRVEADAPKTQQEVARESARRLSHEERERDRAWENQGSAHTRERH